MPPDKKKAPLSVTSNHLEEIIFLLAGLLILGVIISQILAYLQYAQGTELGGFWAGIIDFLIRFWPVWKVLAVIITIVCIFWTIYSLRRITEINEEENKIFGTRPDEGFLEARRPKEKGNEKWLRVQEHANSANPADWRLAILEADIMLDEVLRSKGLVGDGVGEMLKSVDQSDMLTLNNAWDAHKVRNQIAHAGGDFQLTERETRRVITLFESVFKEFQVI